MRIIEQVLRMEGIDVCGAAVLVLLLWTVADRMVQREPKLREWGVRIGIAALVVGFTVLAVHDRPAGPWDVIRLAIIALILAGIMTGLAWIVLSIGSFLYFVGIKPVLDAADRMDAAARKASQDRQRRQQEHQRRRREQEDYDRQAPERERQRQEADAKARADAEAKRLREEARAELRLYFDAHERVIGDLFPRPLFQDFFERYLTDGHSVEFVRTQAGKMLETLKRLAERNDPAAKASEQAARDDAERVRSRIERDAARKELETFWRDHEPVLGAHYPFSMLRAFIHSEMHDGIEPEKAWLTCRTQIAELQRLMAQARERQQQEESVNRKPTAEELHKEIQRLLTLGMKPDAIAAQMAGFLEKKTGKRRTPDDL